MDHPHDWSNPRREIVFYLNGTRQTIQDDRAGWTLARWLREDLGLVGTKVVCNEGDCGACSVLVGRASDGGAPLSYLAIDSCIAFLFQLDRTHVVTVEGLAGESEWPRRGELQVRKSDAAEPVRKSDAAQLTPVQDAVVRCHASQCGFCTPGFVIALHGMIESKSPIDDASLRYWLSGNLCRCTGYRQILDAGKSIDRAACAAMSDIYDEASILRDFASLGDAPVLIEATQTYAIARTIGQAVAFKSTHAQASIVAGGTDYGVLRNHDRLDAGDVLCLVNVAEMQSIETVDSGRAIRIGGGVTWQRIECHVRDLLPDYHRVITRFGSPQIRAAATIAGNLASGSPIADCVPLHLVLPTEIELASVRGTRRIRLEDFYLGYRKTAIAGDELITSVVTQLPRADEQVRLFKISKRRDMDISTVTFGLWVRMDGNTIAEARIAFGGVGPIVLRIAAAETFLVGKKWCHETMLEAGRIARRHVNPWSDVRGTAEYRGQLVENLPPRSLAP